jgi:hypothetical protein
VHLHVLFLSCHEVWGYGWPEKYQQVQGKTQQQEQTKEKAHDGLLPHRQMEALLTWQPMQLDDRLQEALGSMSS